MRKFTILTVLAIMFAMNLNATIWTVNNYYSSPGQFTNLQTAINNSSAGDTIYVSGSPWNYGSITLNHQLTIIGTGHRPDTQFGFKSMVNDIYLDSLQYVSGPSGTIIEGLMIYDDIKSNTSHTVRHVIIRKCWMNESSYHDQINVLGRGWIIENNILSKINVNYYTNVVIRNNIINNTYGYSSSDREISIFNSSHPTVNIINNIFIGSTGSHAVVFKYMSHAIIANNIFYGRKPSQNCSYCTFNNNISFATTNNAFLTGTNTGANNLPGVDPQWVNVPVGGYAFSYSYDYNLQPTSPGVNAGTDGTDIGIYGGTHPYIYTGMPAIPQIIEMNVQNSNIPANDSLQIQVKARKQD